MRTVREMGYLCSQAVLAQDLDRAGLRSVFTEFLDIADTRADADVRAAFQNTVAIEIDLLAVSSLEETELAAWIDPHYGPDRLFFVELCLAAHKARLVLQLPPRSLERIVNCKSQIGVTLILFGRPPDIDLAPFRKRESDSHLVLTTCLVAITWAPHDDAPRGRSTILFLQLGNVLINGSLQGWGRRQILEFNLGRGLHDLAPPIGPPI